VEVRVQLQIADGSVASSLGYESAVSSTLRRAGLKLYPRHPGTQDSVQATLFRVPVADEEAAARAVELLRDHDGVKSVGIA
jgi:hypothetical protein